MTLCFSFLIYKMGLVIQIFLSEFSVFHEFWHISQGLAILKVALNNISIHNN